MKYLSVFSLCLKACAQFKGRILLSFLMTVITSITFSLRPYYIKEIIDRASIISGDLMVPVWLFLGVSFLTTVCHRLDDWNRLKYIPSMRHFISNKLMSYLYFHSYGFYQNHFSGGLGNRVTACMNGVPEIINIVNFGFLRLLLNLASATWILSTLAPKYAWGVSIWACITIVAGIIFSKYSKENIKKTAEITSRLVGFMVDILPNILNVKLFAGQQREEVNFITLQKEYTVKYQKREWFILKFSFYRGLSYLCFQTVCLYWLVADLKAGLVTPGGFALILTLNTSILDMLFYVSEDLKHFVDHFGTVEEATRIITSPPKITEIPEALDLKVTDGKIAFSNISFSYGENHQLFENLSLTISGGSRVGLVGYSGSGKTTFANLILRLFDLEKGKILIDGQDIKQVSLKSLYKAISLIPQEPSLFHRSLYANIQYGKWDAIPDEVYAASTAAHCHEFISKLEKGYETLVGERGIKLSGGQRQRVAIARVILKNAPILILDEATSALDSVTEKNIQESLKKAMEQKTTLVIAHRLSTLMELDRILVFDKGKIVEDGTHEALLHQNGLYTKMWKTQVNGFLPDS